MVKGPDDFAPWRRWLPLVVGRHHGAKPASPATKIAAVKCFNLNKMRSNPDLSK